MVVEPEFADNHEGDQPAHEFRHQLDQLPTKFADACYILEMRHFQFEHQQRDDDREHRVAEGFGAGETELAAGEPFEKLHPRSLR